MHKRDTWLTATHWVDPESEREIEGEREREHKMSETKQKICGTATAAAARITSYIYRIKKKTTVKRASGVDCRLLRLLHFFFSTIIISYNIKYNAPFVTCMYNVYYFCIAYIVRRMCRLAVRCSLHFDALLYYVLFIFFPCSFMFILQYIYDKKNSQCGFRIICLCVYVNVCEMSACFCASIYFYSLLDFNFAKATEQYFFYNNKKKRLYFLSHSHSLALGVFWSIRSRTIHCHVFTDRTAILLQPCWTIRMLRDWNNMNHRLDDPWTLWTLNDQQQQWPTRETQRARNTETICQKFHLLGFTFIKQTVMASKTTKKSPIANGNGISHRQAAKPMEAEIHNSYKFEYWSRHTIELEIMNIMKYIDIQDWPQNWLKIVQFSFFIQAQRTEVGLITVRGKWYFGVVFYAVCCWMLRFTYFCFVFYVFFC